MDKPILGQTASDGKGGFSSETGNGADPAPELDWKLPSPELYKKLRLLGPADQDVFFDFIDKALRANADPEAIIKACLETQSPYRAATIHRWAIDCGGEEYVKRIIAQKLNELPKQGELPIINIPEGGETHKHWRTVEKHLRERKCPVYVRGKHLVQPLWRWHKDSEGRDHLAAELERYSLPQLTDMIAYNACRFRVCDRRRRVEGMWLFKDPPKPIVEALLDAHHYGLPNIIGFITSPTIRRDLTLLTQEGYDEATQLYYKSGGQVTLPPIAYKEKPTPKGAEDALDLLNNLIDGFPFEGERRC